MYITDLIPKVSIYLQPQCSFIPIKVTLLQLAYLRTFLTVTQKHINFTLKVVTRLRDIPSKITIMVAFGNISLEKLPFSFKFIFTKKTISSRFSDDELNENVVCDYHNDSVPRKQKLHI